jgi:hypothetical protein
MLGMALDLVHLCSRASVAGHLGPHRNRVTFAGIVVQSPSFIAVDCASVFLSAGGGPDLTQPLLLIN